MQRSLIAPPPPLPVSPTKGRTSATARVKGPDRGGAIRLALAGTSCSAPLEAAARPIASTNVGTTPEREAPTAGRKWWESAVEKLGAGLDAGRTEEFAAATSPVGGLVVEPGPAVDDAGDFLGKAEDDVVELA